MLPEAHLCPFFVIYGLFQGMCPIAMFFLLDGLAGAIWARPFCSWQFDRTSHGFSKIRMPQTEDMWKSGSVFGVLLLFLNAPAEFCCLPAPLLVKLSVIVKYRAFAT